jgi:hypothetical protein
VELYFILYYFCQAMDIIITQKATINSEWQLDSGIGNKFFAGE